MQVKVSTNRFFVGAYELADLIGDNEIIGTGSLIEAGGKKYLVHTVRLRKDGTAAVEVSPVK